MNANFNLGLEIKEWIKDISIKRYVKKKIKHLTPVGQSIVDSIKNDGYIAISNDDEKYLIALTLEKDYVLEIIISDPLKPHILGEHPLRNTYFKLSKYY